ncbi:MAG: thiamine pyrophosphate-dependent enzyme, partial [Phycisphaerales bacterium]|nr:thiamine pyrophosphate-dependent enzyme [Phycisphaerales bacterium]
RKYRSREEEEVYETGDPIAQLRDHMMDSGGLDEDSFKAMAKEVRGEVKESIKWAEASPPPSVDEELYRDVYVEAWGPYTGTTEPEIVRDADSGKGEG